MIKRSLWILGLVVLGLTSFTATTFAANGADAAGDSVIDLAKPVVDAFLAGQGYLAAALTLVLGVALARRYLPQWFPKRFAWVAGDAGGVLTSFLMSFGGALSLTLANGESPTWGMLKSALEVAGGGMSIFVTLKKLAVPALRALQAKAPAWMRPILALLIWVAERPDAITKATKAGDDAVAEKPPTGTASIVGKPRDIP